MLARAMGTHRVSMMIVCSALALVAGTSLAGAQTPGATLRIGTDVDLVTFDPPKLTGGGQVQFWSSVYDTLLYITPDGQIRPNAASKFNYSDDRKVLTLTIRKGMTFTDGSPVDPAAVVASIKAFRAGNGPDARYLVNVADITAQGDDVVITLSTPDPALLFYLGGDAGTIVNLRAASADVNFDPHGSGPYTLDKSKSTKGAVYTFQRNEKYWNKDAYPYATVVMTPLVDPTARLNALKSGQIDAAPVTAQNQAEAKAAGLTVASQYLGISALHIRDLKGTKVPALGNLKVRQAMNMVFDRTNITKFLLNGLGEPTQQLFLPTNQAFVQGGDEHYPYDVAKAKELMKEAGYADGFAITMPSTLASAVYEPVITQSLGQIGIKVNWVKVPDTQVTSRLLSGEFPVFYLQGASRFAWFDINLWIAPGAQWNSYKIDEPALTSQIQKAQLATSDDAAKQAYQAVGRYILENAWFVPLARPQNFHATRRNLVVQPQFGISSPPVINYSEK